CSTHHLPACSVFFFTPPPTPDIYPLSLHDALPICLGARVQPRYWLAANLVSRFARSSRRLDCVHSQRANVGRSTSSGTVPSPVRSEEHTSELQSPYDLVCRLLLEKKKQKKTSSEKE